MSPTISRDYPTKKNEVWGIDGTAHNENISDGKTTRQHLYKISIYDYATCRLLSVATIKGVNEAFSITKEAIQAAIKEVGYKPMVLQCDHGPAFNELKSYCKEIGITLLPAATGNARSKPVENLQFQMDNDVIRYLKGYNGQNLRALGPNSRISAKYEKTGLMNARDMAIAAEWLRTEGKKMWNERIITQLNGKPCNKTPFELWDELASETKPLSLPELAQLCGTKHHVKLTNDGLTVQDKKIEYTYFPTLNTKEEIEEAEKIFRETPRFTPESSKLDIYVLEYGKPAVVFSHDGKLIGTWIIKERVPFLATFKKDTAVYNKMRDLQAETRDKAKEIKDTTTQFAKDHPDAELIEQLASTPLVGKRRPYVGRYNKEAFLQEEADIKGGIETLRQVLEETPEYIEYVNPDTGEIHKLRKDKQVN